MARKRSRNDASIADASTRTKNRAVRLFLGPQKQIAYQFSQLGLSWRNLSHAYGSAADPADWGVLYLGAAPSSSHPLQILSRSMHPVEKNGAFKGIVAIDGSWKQAKSMWWRNPWLLKMKRIVLNPSSRSLRGQTKEQALSTAEATAFALRHMGDDSAVADALEKFYTEQIIRPHTTG